MSKIEENPLSEIFSNYLSSQDIRFRQCLIDLRNLIKSIIPDAEETFSYQVHCFKHIYMLVGIGANQQFCSLHTMSPQLAKQVKSEYPELKVSGATIHFKPNEPLPVEIIRQIAATRIRENEILALSVNGKLVYPKA